ncbi:hypothetical protein [Sphingomonas immobilis]|uniref:Uncharacterized protein n=1 Tax=Sphingomonas immobilis TaxID=3063997 RepID=A0ABT8ZYV3_9SPHN|nr:hypothetical protein [Sphingomonas sp. CA1-15]MDO7842756.1 hypothetical protein [Sphingomonas sp. CA1-15]
MTDLPYRPFESCAAVRETGERFLARTLPKEEWTHEAHLSTTLWLIRDRPDIDVDARIAGLISAYNASVGGVNDATQGYHDTITRCFIAGVRACLRDRPEGEPLVEAVNALLASPAGRRDWPLRFYSEARLMSVEARLGFMEPDLQPLPR